MKNEGMKSYVIKSKSNNFCPATIRNFNCSKVINIKTKTNQNGKKLQKQN